MSEFKPQPNDFFNLTGTGISPSETPAPEAPAVLSATTPYYSSYYNGVPKELGYTFMYWNGVAYPNPIPNGIEYFGAIAINGLSLAIDQIIITNNYTDSITIDLLKASPANTIEDGQNIIPPVQLARYTIASGDTVSLNKDDIDIKLSNHVAQTQSNPYYLTGDGLALAFPDATKVTTTVTTTHPTSTTTTKTTTVTTSNMYGVYNVNVSATAHYEQ